ncbi:MAG: hypothetical protein HYV06_04385 [Deltaproteobacteria bacterium]|nr:hypothetical protein [Deltaproteobacteria bacterium]
MSKKAPKNVKRHTAASIRFIETLMKDSSAMLIRHGESRPDAQQLSRDFALEISRKLSGGLMYFGKNTYLEAHARHGQIRDDYREGATIEQLAEKYSLSTRRIHSVIHELKNTPPAKAATTGAPAIAVIAARMMMKIGLDQNDAANAARGLLAVIAAKFGGTALYIPKQNKIQAIIRDIEIFRAHRAGKSITTLTEYFQLSEEEIKTVIEYYPAPKLSEGRLTELSLINGWILEVAATCREDPEMHAPLEIAADNVAKARNVAKKQDVITTHMKGR